VQDWKELLGKADALLRSALADYEESRSNPLAREFYELRLQGAMFHYDLAYDIVSLWTLEPSGFAEKLALKSTIHKLYEYEQVLSGRLIARMLALAHARNIPVPTAAVKEERKKWKTQLARLQSWSRLRNEVSGHYGKDIHSQVRLLQGIRRIEVVEVLEGLLSFNIYALNILRAAGRGEP
jgi:hypothetical protein